MSLWIQVSPPIRRRLKRCWTKDSEILSLVLHHAPILTKGYLKRRWNLQKRLRLANSEVRSARSKRKWSKEWLPIPLNSTTSLGRIWLKISSGRICTISQPSWLKTRKRGRKPIVLRSRANKIKSYRRSRRKSWACRIKYNWVKRLLPTKFKPVKSYTPNSTKKLKSWPIITRRLTLNSLESGIKMQVSLCNLPQRKMMSTRFLHG